VLPREGREHLHALDLAPFGPCKTLNVIGITQNCHAYKIPGSTACRS